ncbi:MAG: biotin synthase BioB [Planctomycetota bacterium]|nr:biotin synthase BioB [Planctomycetota bacterium]
MSIPVQSPPATPETPPSTSQVEILALFERPLLELVFEAAQVHRAHHDPREVQRSQLLSIKTGGCSEDCGYCSQSAHFKTPVEREKLLGVDEVLAAAAAAKEGGSGRFCMGAAWREVKDGPEFERVLDMVRGVRELGMETCVTLGMLNESQAERLREAGLDYYNHNLDTGRSHYDEVVTTHSYDERLNTLANVRGAGLAVCAGGILGLGESRAQRAELIAELASLDPQPESVPINNLVPIEGTPIGGEQGTVDWSEMVRTVAAARIAMPKSRVRLSAGRRELGEEAQALCFLAGANSIFTGDELLTTPNPSEDVDAALFEKLGLYGTRR